MEKVMCPWCGGEMELIHVSSYAECGGYPFYQYRCCGCNAMSPPKETEEDACAAATRRPPNLPLTVKQIIGLDKYDAVWLYSTSEKAISVSLALKAQNDPLLAAYIPLRRVFAFAAKPSSADIEAARKEQFSNICEQSERAHAEKDWDK